MPFPFYLGEDMKQEDYERVLALRRAGCSYAQIAAEFGVPKNSVKPVLQQVRYPN